MRHAVARHRIGMRLPGGRLLSVKRQRHQSDRRHQRARNRLHGIHSVQWKQLTFLTREVQRCKPNHISGYCGNAQGKMPSRLPAAIYLGTSSMASIWAYRLDNAATTKAAK